MALPDLPDRLQDSGREYYEKLTALGLHPEVFLWVYDPSRRGFSLCLVWSGVERFGPLQLSKKLFAAYRASVLPREIDPFRILIHGSKDAIGLGIIESIRKIYKEGRYYRIKRNGNDEDIVYEWKAEWIYQEQKRTFDRFKVGRDWAKFSEQVDRLAA